MSNIEVPLFPLNIFLLPKEEDELHIFEKRYLQLIDKSVNENALFGVPYVREQKLLKYGSLVRVKKVLKRIADGRKDILIECVDNFELKSFTKVQSPNLYGAGDIVVFENLSDYIAGKKLAELFKKYMVKFFEQSELLEYEFLTLADIAISIDLENSQKINLISAESTKEKEKLLINAIKYLLLLKNQEEKLDFNFYLN